MTNDSASPMPRRRRYASRKEAFREIGVGNTKGHDLINRGLIKAVKLDGKTLICMDSVDRFLDSLPSALAA